MGRERGARPVPAAPAGYSRRSRNGKTAGRPGPECGRSALPVGGEPGGRVWTGPVAVPRTPRAPGTCSRLPRPPALPLPPVTRLSVNLNKAALMRNARGGARPDLDRLGRVAVEAGAVGLTLHPRPDGRHALASDVEALAAWLPDGGHELNVEGNPFEGAGTHRRLRVPRVHGHPSPRAPDPGHARPRRPGPAHERPRVGPRPRRRAAGPARRRAPRARLPGEPVPRPRPRRRPRRRRARGRPRRALHRALRLGPGPGRRRTPSWPATTPPPRRPPRPA